MFEQTLQQQQRPSNRWWPKIEDYSSAADAMRNGAIGYTVVSAMTMIISLIAFFSGRAQLGANGWSFLDAALFAVIAWRVFRHSLPWAIFGIILYVAEKIIMMVSHASPNPGVLSILLILYFYHAVRGGMYLRKHRNEEMIPVEVSAS